MQSVLVIDDDSGIRELLADTLQEAGFHVHVAQNGVHGLRAFAQNPADLVITDILMPEKEGCSTIVDLRDIAPDVRVIAMSGGNFNSADAYLNLAREVGADKVIEKPFMPSELLSIIKELLD